ncbi:MAG TPA: CAP domain-containing protein [Steroidobacteraceae bacterium]
MCAEIRQLGLQSGAAVAWSRLWLAALAVVFQLLYALPAKSDVLSVVNAARLHSCPGGAGRPPLKANTALNAAALALARGFNLDNATLSVGYRASKATAVHLTGAGSDQAIAAMLLEHECPALSDASLSQLGAVRRGAELWIIVAAPFAPPRPQDADAVGRRVLVLVNQARRDGQRCGTRTFAPAAGLTLEATLSEVALRHSEDMARLSELSHEGPNGSTPAQRVRAAGFQPRGIVGENVAAGAVSAEEVVRGWLASPEHCENLMDGRFSQMGVAYAVNLESSSAIYWTQVLASAR